MESKTNEKKKDAYRVGVAVFIVLVVLSIGEFFIGRIAINWTWPLWGIILIKAALIIRDYMHVSRLFGGAEE
jgi:Na+(H+)/acetate symporter ActP